MPSFLSSFHKNSVWRLAKASLLPLVLLGVFLLFFFLPIAKVLKEGLVDANGHFTFFYLKEIFHNPLYLEGIWNSLRIGIATTLLSLLISLPLAWLGNRYDFPGKKWLSGLLLLPMILAPFVGAVGLQSILGKFGALNACLEALHLIRPGTGPDWLAGKFFAVILLEALHLYPILYLNLNAAFANVDPLLLEAAEDYGCTGFRRFRKIHLPLIAPGMFAGCSLVFLWSFTELGTPLMFHYGRCTPVQIYQGLNDLGRDAMPYALVIFVMTVSALLYLLSKLLWGKTELSSAGKAGRGSTCTKASGIKGICITLLFLLIILLAVLPHFGVLGNACFQSWYQTVLPSRLTTEHFQGALGHSLTVPSILNSLRYSLLATAIALCLGIFSAIRIVRGKGWVGHFLDLMVMLPLAVPGIVLAFGYLALGQKGELFQSINPIENPTILLVISYAIRRLPYIVRAAVAGLQQISRTYEEAASSLGASAGATFRRITLPLISANLIAGGILTFSFSMLEVSDSLLLAQKAVYFPITRAIFELSTLLGEGSGLAAALGVWTMLFLGTSLLTASWILGKKLGALFRV